MSDPQEKPMSVNDMLYREALGQSIKTQQTEKDNEL